MAFVSSVVPLVALVRHVRQQHLQTIFWLLTASLLLVCTSMPATAFRQQLGPCAPLTSTTSRRGAVAIGAITVPAKVRNVTPW
jgi:hypothetical protein